MPCTCHQKPSDLTSVVRNIRDNPDLHTERFYCNLQVRDWHRLDSERVRRLNLKPLFARTYDVSRNDPPVPPVKEGLMKCRTSTLLPQQWDNLYDIRNKFDHANVKLPFSTTMKNFCSIRFRWDTDHRMRKWSFPVPSPIFTPHWKVIANYDDYS